jgi:hypothetical protein
VLALTVNHGYQVTEEINISEGESYMGWTESGTYLRNLVAVTGCDSMVTTNLYVLKAWVTEEEFVLCEGDSYNGWTTSGRYERTLKSVSGGDSIVVTYLTVNPVYSINPEASICEGETFTLGSQLLSESGEYVEVFESVMGCDSIVVLTLTVNHDYQVTEEISISEGESYMGWTESGTYQRNLVAVTGCDSILVTNLFVEPITLQTIELQEGWNIISSYLIPVDEDMESIMESLQSSGKLVKVQDEVNNTLEYRNKNVGWINGIGNYQKTEGYKVQVTTSCLLELKGETVSLPFNIPLSGGWNIISFPGQEAMDAMQVVQSLIDADILVKVQDEAGNSIEYWKNRGWLNGIGNFEPGEGYIIQVKSGEMLSIDENFNKSGYILAKSAETSYFKVDYQGNGFDHMNVNIVDLAGSGLKPGDEIAAFDNGICVGAVKLTAQHFSLNALSIPASASEEGLNNGYVEGNTVTLKVWSSEKEEEISIFVKPLEGDMIYNRQASVFVTLSNLTVSASEFLDSDITIDVYPNPAIHNVNIRFSEMPELGTTVALFDMAGKQLITNDVEADLTVMHIEDLPSGIYIIQVPVKGRIIPHKIVKR